MNATKTSRTVDKWRRRSAVIGIAGCKCVPPEVFFNMATGLMITDFTEPRISIPPVAHESLSGPVTVATALSPKCLFDGVRERDD